MPVSDYLALIPLIFLIMIIIEIIRFIGGGKEESAKGLKLNLPGFLKKSEGKKGKKVAKEKAIEKTEEQIDEKQPEKISTEKISAFFDVLKIGSETKFKKDLEKERILYNEFIELQKKKNTFVKNFLNLWNEIKGSDFKKVKKEYKSLIDQNNKIIKILKKIIVKDVASSVFFKLIVEQEKNHEHLNKYEDKHKKEIIINIKRYILKLNEELKFLKKYLKEENEYITENDVLESHKDLEEHGVFYRLIEGENTVFNNIKIHILNLLRFLKLVEKPSESILKKLQRLRIMPVRYSNSEFRDFYDEIYTKRFKEDEAEEFENFEFSFKEHKRWPDDYAYHVLLAKIDNDVVGGIISEIFVYQIDDKEDETRKVYDMLDFYKKNFNVDIKNNKICFGVVWWFATIEEKKLPKDIGKRLLEVAYHGMEKEADSMGVELSCVIAEADPTDTRLIRFFKRLGVKECFKDYIQITSDGKYAEHLTLYIKPISKFKNSISRNNLLTIIEGLQFASNEIKIKDLKKHSAYLKMVKDILKEKNYKLK